MRCRGLIALLIWGQSVAAADLGTWGDLWPVKEPDMLTVIMQRLTALEQSGEMGRKMDAFKERVIRNSLRPPAVPGIGRTEKYGSRLFDPSVRLAADIRDNEGRAPELREAVYSLINRDVERALSGLESVKPSQVPRQEGAWAPEHSVTEFSHSQEAKLAEAQQKSMLKGEAFPDVPMTLYEAIVRDYTGRTPKAREQTLIVTHLNEDRRVLNSMIHDAREKAGELGQEQVMVPVLNTANIRDGELRRLSTWETHRDARTDTWLQSLLVWSPGQRDIIKTVALVLMVLDHANRILHLDQSWMFLVGRGAFPLFALVWGLNLSRHTHIRQEAINRLWGWAVIAQFAYYLAGFPWYEGNILFAFAVATQVLTWCETRTWWRSAETMLLLAMWLPFSGTSYGIAGLLMLAVSHRLYRAEDRMERLALVACLLAVIPALNLATSDAAAVAGLVMTVLTVGLVSCAGKSLPRFWPGDFFPTFYACHLAVLGVLAL